MFHCEIGIVFPIMMAFKATFKSAVQKLASLLILQGGFKQLVMEYKMVMRLTLLFTAWNKEYLVNCLFCKFQGLREEKMNTFIANEQYNHLYTRAEILKSFCKVRPLNKLKGFRYYQIVVTLISLLESFRRSFISVVLLL